AGRRSDEWSVDRAPIGSVDQPQAAELGHALAEDLPGLLVGDVVVERASRVGRLEAAVAPAGRPEKRGLPAPVRRPAARVHVGRPFLGARSGAFALATRVAREGVDGKAAAVEENAAVLRRVHGDARPRSGGCRSWYGDRGGHCDDGEKSAHWVLLSECGHSTV